MNHLEHVAPIFPNQWCRTVYHLMDDGHDMCTISFDIRRAFDSILHQLLMEKLKMIALNDYLLHWVHTFLFNETGYGQGII